MHFIGGFVCSFQGVNGPCKV